MPEIPSAFLLRSVLKLYYFNTFYSILGKLIIGDMKALRMIKKCVKVMGLTFLAAGTSVPDLITSVIVARYRAGLKLLNNIRVVRYRAGLKLFSNIIVARYRADLKLFNNIRVFRYRAGLKLFNNI